MDFTQKMILIDLSIFIIGMVIGMVITLITFYNEENK
jgi:hypothetical protein